MASDAFTAERMETWHKADGDVVQLVANGAWFSPIYLMQQKDEDTVECVSNSQMLQTGYDDTNEYYE